MCLSVINLVIAGLFDIPQIHFIEVDHKHNLKHPKVLSKCL